MASFPKRLLRIFFQNVFSSLVLGVLTVGVVFFLHLPPVLPSSETIRLLKEKIAELNDQIQQREVDKKDLELKETKFTETIKSLKNESKTVPSLYLNLRIENSLKQLRSILIALREAEKNQALLRDELFKTNTDLKEEMEKEINRLIQSAQEAFQSGNEIEADRDYKDALQLMEEHKQFQMEYAINNIVVPPRVEILLDGKETPEKLRELTDFARNDIENFDREIKNLQEEKSRIQEEVALRQNLIKYAELTEREGNRSINQRGILEKELLNFKKTLKTIGNKIIKYKGAIQTLTREIKRIENLIQQKEDR